MQQFLQRQQMELHQAQAQYAAYSAMAAVGIFISREKNSGFSPPLCQIEC